MLKQNMFNYFLTIKILNNFSQTYLGYYKKIIHKNLIFLTLDQLHLHFLNIKSLIEKPQARNRKKKRHHPTNTKEKKGTHTQKRDRRSTPPPLKGKQRTPFPKPEPTL